jgi:hypothetical protein
VAALWLLLRRRAKASAQRRTASWQAAWVRPRALGGATADDGGGGGGDWGSSSQRRARQVPSKGLRKRECAPELLRERSSRRRQRLRGGGSLALPSTPRKGKGPAEDCFWAGCLGATQSSAAGDGGGGGGDRGSSSQRRARQVPSKGLRKRECAPELLRERSSRRRQRLRGGGSLPLPSTPRKGKCPAEDCFWAGCLGASQSSRGGGAAAGDGGCGGGDWLFLTTPRKAGAQRGTEKERVRPRAPEGAQQPTTSAAARWRLSGSSFDAAQRQGPSGGLLLGRLLGCVPELPGRGRSGWRRWWRRR